MRRKCEACRYGFSVQRDPWTQQSRRWRWHAAARSGPASAWRLVAAPNSMRLYVLLARIPPTRNETSAFRPTVLTSALDPRPAGEALCSVPPLPMTAATSHNCRLIGGVITASSRCRSGHPRATPFADQSGALEPTWGHAGRREAEGSRYRLAQETATTRRYADRVELCRRSAQWHDSIESLATRSSTTIDHGSGPVSVQPISGQINGAVHDD